MIYRPVCSEAYATTYKIPILIRSETSRTSRLPLTKNLSVATRTANAYVLQTGTYSFLNTKQGGAGATAHSANYISVRVHIEYKL